MNEWVVVFRVWQACDRRSCTTVQGFSKGATSSSPENLVKVQILETHSRPPKSEPLGWGSIIHISFFKKLKNFCLSSWFWNSLRFTLPNCKRIQKTFLYPSPSFPNVAILHNHSAVITPRSDTDATLLPNLQTLSKFYQLSFSSWAPIQDYTLHLAAMLPYSL